MGSKKGVGKCSRCMSHCHIRSNSLSFNCESILLSPFFYIRDIQTSNIGNMWYQNSLVNLCEGNIYNSFLLSIFTQAFTRAQYGVGTGPIWLTHLHCDGTEETLASCSHEGWNTSYSGMPQTWRLESSTSGTGSLIRRASDCASHNYDASVYCFGKGMNTAFIERTWAYAWWAHMHHCLSVTRPKFRLEKSLYSAKSVLVICVWSKAN